MTVRSLLRRGGVVTAASTALVVLGATAASAHHCFVPMYSLNGPTQDKNWFVISAEMGASFDDEAGNPGYTTECDAARDAGYAALKEAGLPVAIKVFDKMTIGEGNNLNDGTSETTGSGRGAATNPNGANSKGLEYFGAGSPLPFEMVGTYIAGAESATC